MHFPLDHPRGPSGGPIFLGEELCPICECCSMSSEDCDNCGGTGFSGHDCGEDVCCCADPEDDDPCDWCDGEGGHLACLGGCSFSTKTKHGPLQDGGGGSREASRPAGETL